MTAFVTGYLPAPAPPRPHCAWCPHGAVPAPGTSSGICAACLKRELAGLKAGRAAAGARGGAARAPMAATRAMEAPRGGTAGRLRSHFNATRGAYLALVERSGTAARRQALREQLRALRKDLRAQALPQGRAQEPSLAGAVRERTQRPRARRRAPEGDARLTAP